MFLEHMPIFHCIYLLDQPSISQFLHKFLLQFSSLVLLPYITHNETENEMFCLQKGNHDFSSLLTTMTMPAATTANMMMMMMTAAATGLIHFPPFQQTSSHDQLMGHNLQF
jgi:hypothetical protein